MQLQHLIVSDIMQELGFKEASEQPFLPYAFVFRHKNELSCTCIYAIDTDELAFEEDCLKYLNLLLNQIKNDKYGVRHIENFSHIVLDTKQNENQ